MAVVQPEGRGLSHAHKTCSNIPTWHGSHFEEKTPHRGKEEDRPCLLLSLLLCSPSCFLITFRVIYLTLQVCHTGEGRRKGRGKISAPPCPHFFSLSCRMESTVSNPQLARGDTGDGEHHARSRTCMSCEVPWILIPRDPDS